MERNIQKVRLNWEQRASLRDQIKEYYFVKCWTPREIAKATKVEIKAVERYVDLIRNSQRKLVSANKNVFDDVHTWVYEIQGQVNHVTRVAWNEFTKAVSVKDRMACVDRVMEAMRMRITLLQSMGIIPKVEGGGSAGVGRSIVYKSHIKTDGTIQTQVEVKGGDLPGPEVVTVVPEVSNEAVTV